MVNMIKVPGVNCNIKVKNAAQKAAHIVSKLYDGYNIIWILVAMDMNILKG